MGKLKLALAAFAMLVLWQGCAAGRRSIDFRQAEWWESDLWTPAGDSTIYRPVIIETRKSIFAEYPSRREIKHLALEEWWTADSPHVATVRRGGVIQTHTPGWAWFTLRLRGIKQRLRVRVELPMDSVVMRFPVREGHVGDTVELFYRRYYADGLEEAGHRWAADTKDRDRNGIPIAQHVHVPTTISGSGAEGDTIRFWLRRPGIFRVRSVTHGRLIDDSIRVLPATGAPGVLIRQPWGVGPQMVATRHAFRCYALTYGDFREGRFAEPRSDYAFLPVSVALDSTLVVRDRPDLGMRIHALPGERLEIRRHWNTVGDSIRMFFETKEDVMPHSRVDVVFPVLGESVTGRARRSAAVAEVHARSISCS